ncbi:c-type cytochrome [Inquilinus limosus]|uniref:c-type cytochrome n=1 Tax=Inquilinus limosus TaxID=171674 RepID=UPI003F142B28
MSRRRTSAPALAAPLCGCAGVQSALVPRGTEAQEIDALFWTVTGVAVVVTALVLAATALALYGPAGWRRFLAADRMVVGGGILLPVVVLSALLAYGLLVMQAGAARSRSAEGPGVTITGKRWWWQVVYEDRDGRRIVSANELRLPVGRPVAVRLETDDVIHSFWAPQLGGKLDMIPGRTNVLTLEATEAGVSRAQCAEYCGGAHALMSLYVVALAPSAYDAWLAAEAAPARPPASEPARRGLQLFLQNGCGACHAVRGTEAAGTIGPDLTHVGGRLSLGAAALPNDAEAFMRWIADNQHVKPGNLMPPYRSLSQDELAAIAAYLEGLD